RSDPYRVARRLPTSPPSGRAGWPSPSVRARQARSLLPRPPPSRGLAPSPLLRPPLVPTEPGARRCAAPARSRRSGPRARANVATRPWERPSAGARHHRSSSTSSPPTPHATARTAGRAHQTGPPRRGLGRALVWRGTVSAALHPPVLLPSPDRRRAEASADGKRAVWVKLTAPLLVLRRRERRGLVRRHRQRARAVWE